MIIDFHLCIGHSLFGWEQTASSALKEMDRLEIEKAVICPVKPFDYHFEPENRRSGELARSYPDRFFPFVRLDPWRKEKALEDLKQCVQEFPVKGLFLHPQEETYPVNSPIVDPLVSMAKQADLIVMIAGGHHRFSRALQISDLVSRHRNTRFVITSGGQINISGAALDEGEQLLRENDNVWMETSGIYREDFIEDMAKKYGSHRVIFGSGSPEYDQEYELKRVLWAHLPKEDRIKIAGLNAWNLLEDLAC